VATILIVDDERPIRELLADILRAEGHEALLAAHGREALARVGQARPDLVLTDLMMPVMGGAELCRRLRAGEKTREIPIVVMSTLSAWPADRYGADASLDKPFDLDRLLALVDRWAPPD
jgi:CheY-like chemotaxis protein